MKNKEKSEFVKKNINAISKAATCGVEFASAIVVGIFIGYKLDKYFDASPIFLIIFFLLGCVAGCLNLYKLMKDNNFIN